MESIPLLAPGDRLSRAEFERRYEAMPSLKKAELLEGIVHLPSPVRMLRHGQPQFNLTGWLGIYSAYTPLTIGGHNATVRLDRDNELQPDSLLMIDPARGGQAKISDDDFVENGPELVADVVSESATYLLSTKREVYRRNGVREYLVWCAADDEIDWFVRCKDAYEPMSSDKDGIFRSEVFPGLWLDAAALMRGDSQRVLAIAHQGIASAEHAAFLAK